MRFRFKCFGLFRLISGMAATKRILINLLKMFLTMWREEFTAEKFCLTHFPGEDFTICGFQKKTRVLPLWIAYRTILFLYFLATFIYVVTPVGKGILEEDQGKFFIFLTNWTYTLQTVVFSLAFFIVVARYRKEKNSQEVFQMQTVPASYKVFWALYNTVLSSAVIVSVVFWTMVFDPVMFPADDINIILHTGNSVFMIVDFVLIGHPIRFLHFYWPAVYGIIYVLFSVIYYFAGGRGVKGMVAIYKILDWRESGKAIAFCFLCLFFVFSVHVMFSLLSQCKRWMKKKYGNN